MEWKMRSRAKLFPVMFLVHSFRRNKSSGYLFVSFFDPFLCPNETRSPATRRPATPPAAMNENGTVNRLSARAHICTGNLRSGTSRKISRQFRGGAIKMSIYILDGIDVSSAHPFAREGKGVAAKNRRGTLVARCVSRRKRLRDKRRVQHKQKFTAK